MKNKPFFTGIAGGIQNPCNIKVEDLFGQSGLNTGNFLFIKALREILGQKEKVYESFTNAKSVTETEFDYIAISAANWINPDIDLEGLATLIEKTKLPCLVVGLGAQVEFERTAPRLTRGTERFLKLISERSRYISVRGTKTQESLEKYGIYNTWITGCPSILGNSTRARCIPERINIKDPQKIILQGTRHRYSDAIFNSDHISKFNLEIYRYAINNQRPILIQSELADMYYIMDRLNNKEINQKNSEYLMRVYQKSETEIREYLRNHGLLYWNLDDWFEGLSQHEALIGTRIHGVISAILSGIPAVLLTHDERTSELAEVMSLPHKDIRSLEEFNENTINSIISEASFNSFNLNKENYTKNFKDFFNANDIYTQL